MDRKTGNTFNRKVLLTCESAVCVNCEKIFDPTEIIDWIDDNQRNIGQTALCPYCKGESVIGFCGEFNSDWLFNFRKHHFA